MELNKEQLSHLADLAKLELKDEELESYKRELQDVLSYVAKINTLDLQNVKESLSGIDDAGTAPRPDNVEKSNPKIINQACQKDGQYVAVPNVFNNK
ncbi:MAG: Asp-tRNA(Asn)/Glu-tRNA(Gln) amidotransferase subunit GatC [Patescibacteria group bacterium]|jgi:aspartyl-tRNA(Asn)/glutamyl-tRNA(Gln) amidotransferase subunit C